MSLKLPKIKIVIIGPSYCGKTSLIEKLMNETNHSSHGFGVEVNFWVTSDIKFILYDTPGQMNMISITRSFIKSVKNIIFIYDVTNVKSATDYMKNLFYDEKYDFESFILLGNKSDLISKDYPIHLPELTPNLINSTKKLKHKLISAKKDHPETIKKLFKTFQTIFLKI